jgi:hypothetical protein
MGDSVMNNNNYFSAIIGRDGDIYRMGFGKNYDKIGIDNQRESELLEQIAEMQQDLDDYYDTFGKLPVKLTAEQEQLQEQQNINAHLLTAIQALNDKIDRLDGSGKSKPQSKKKGANNDAELSADEND